MRGSVRQRLIREVSEEIADLQSAVDLLDEAAAARVGLNRTDFRVMGVLVRRGSMGAGQLARLAGLSPSTMTTVLDRLERAGYAQRVRDPADRRSVRIEATQEALQWSERLYGPLAAAGRERLQQYTDTELRLLRDFLQASRALQVEHADCIRNGAER
jgi:DNA-binding MarR family transcriptional regulator